MPKIFAPDSASTAPNKNNKLAALLAASWNEYAIVRIDRIENTTASGWQATYGTGGQESSSDPKG